VKQTGERAPVRNHPKRFLDGFQQTRLSDSFLADNDQFDSGVKDWIFLKRAEILAHVSGAFREVRRDVDEWIACERDSAQSTERRYRNWKL